MSVCFSCNAKQQDFHFDNSIFSCLVYIPFLLTNHLPPPRATPYLLKAYVEPPGGPVGLPKRLQQQQQQQQYPGAPQSTPNSMSMPASAYSYLSELQNKSSMAPAPSMPMPPMSSGSFSSANFTSGNQAAFAPPPSGVPSRSANLAPLGSSAWHQGREWWRQGHVFPHSISLPYFIPIYQRRTLRSVGQQCKSGAAGDASVFVKIAYCPAPLDKALVLIL